MLKLYIQINLIATVLLVFMSLMFTFILTNSRYAFLTNLAIIVSLGILKSLLDKFRKAKK